LPIPLNGSDAHELAAIPGIGPARARAIVAHGPYDAAADLVRVPGIGPKLTQRIAAHAFARGPDPACAPGG
jgi:competence protein ComEA